MTTQWVYRFGGQKTDGRADMKNLLWGKGANLAEMSTLGLPVPPGFTITTEICGWYYQNNQSYPAELKEQVLSALGAVEQATGAKFGDAVNPLLLSVRSGARASMPGMMDTVLNLGLNDATVEALATKSGDARFAWDSYRRFIQMYGDVVLNVQHHDFEDILERRKLDDGVTQDNDLSVDALRDIVAEYKAVVKKALGRDFPMDIHEQLWGAIGAVFQSWMTPRAITYRKIQDIPESWGTAVNVQAMVFGNMGNDCATGCCLYPRPIDGRKLFLRRISGQCAR